MTAAKLGQTAQSLDAALYSAFGQSEVSIIYTQLNQYYVVLEVAPEYWQTPGGSEEHLFPSAGHQQPDRERECAACCDGDEQDEHDAAGAEPYGAVSFGYGFVQSCAGRFAERCDA